MTADPTPTPKHRPVKRIRARQAEERCLVDGEFWPCRAAQARPEQPDPWSEVIAEAQASEWKVGFDAGWQKGWFAALDAADVALATPPPVSAAPPLDVEQAFVKGWFAALLYAIDEGGDPTSSEEARRQAAEYARLSHQLEDADALESPIE